MTTEAERRRKYRDSAVLIESGRVLSPQFEQLVAWFSGAQVEILRNLMQYARQRDGWVSEYESSTYLMPDDADWNDIDSIIADLEKKLMGNDNVIWGYGGSVGDELIVDSAIAGTNTLTFATPSVGTVLVVNNIACVSTGAVVTQVNIDAYVAGKIRILKRGPYPVANETFDWTGKLVLAHGDHVRVQFKGCNAGLYLAAYIVGSRMDV